MVLTNILDFQLGRQNCRYESVFIVSYSGLITLAMKTFLILNIYDGDHITRDQI
jgi:hypothetical protein